MTGASEGSEQGTAALRHGIEFPFKLYGLHELHGRGHRLELLGRQKLDAVDYYQLQRTLDDGFQVQYFVNPDTWLIERERQLRALHVDIDPEPQWIETVFSDYRPVNGVQFPYQPECRCGSLQRALTGFSCAGSPAKRARGGRRHACATTPR